MLRLLPVLTVLFLALLWIAVSGQGEGVTMNADRSAAPELSPAVASAPVAGPTAEPVPRTNWSPLSAQEERVIVACGTEPPFSGEFWNHHEAGSYACRRCGALLFPSTAKFDSGTGWPSFDACYPGAVQTRTDPDGQRTEIVCANCAGHLGHLFTGEKMTPLNTRHCVNSLSLRFVPQQEVRTGRAIFAGGCFWGVEHHFRQVPGVWRAISGYTGGEVDMPTYEEVCEGDTGHAEAVEVIYDPARVSYEELAKLFFEIHDPTQLNRQGPDVGLQYRSEVFCTSPVQKQIAQNLIGRLKAKGLPVVTRVTDAAVFWPAEEYHQRYFARTGRTPQCHTRIPRFDP